MTNYDYGQLTNEALSLYQKISACQQRALDFSNSRLSRITELVYIRYVRRVLKWAKTGYK